MYPFYGVEICVCVCVSYSYLSLSLAWNSASGVRLRTCDETSVIAVEPDAIPRREPDLRTRYRKVLMLTWGAVRYEVLGLKINSRMLLQFPCIPFADTLQASYA